MHKRMTGGGVPYSVHVCSFVRLTASSCLIDGRLICIARNTPRFKRLHCSPLTAVVLCVCVCKVRKCLREQCQRGFVALHHSASTRAL
jgi:hypothetical protein